MAGDQETKFFILSQKAVLAGFCLLGLLIALPPLSGQALDRLWPPVYPPAGETALPLALAGGLNNPQPANLDLDGDGLQDLLLFDRAGDVVLPLLRQDDRYVYDPSFRDGFPDLRHWVLVRDFDQDGIADLFAYSSQPGIDGISVYKGRYQDGRLAFQAYPSDGSLLTYELSSGGEVPVFVSRIDYPEVADMDCDGDLDVLTFNVAGGYIEWYRNLSVESGHGLDSLLFTLADECWGGVFESGIGKEVDLAPTPGTCVHRLEEAPGVVVRHAGSTLLTLDPDGNGVRDLILGDLSFTNLNYLTNAGDCQEAWINQQDIAFPSSYPVDLSFFPAAFLVDLTGDGRQELVAAPNALGDGANRDVLWTYTNAAPPGAAPQWFFQGPDQLTRDMVDLGQGLSPAFADIDQDGLLDLVAGNGFRYREGGQRRASLHWFRNVGSPEAPAFRLTDDDFLNLRRFNPDRYGFTPCFVDLDADGDLDLLVGEERGGLFMAENTAGAGQPMAFADWVYPYMDIDVGLGAAPAAYDVNGDGLPDLVIGERNGNLNLFLNRGSAEDPAFGASPDSDFWGEVDARQPGSLVGYGAPLLFAAEEGPRLMLGTQAGALETYAVAPDGQAFDQLDSNYGGLREGFQTRPALADLDGDNLLELAVGNFRGGLSFFQTALLALPSVAAGAPAPDLDFRVFPNPAGAAATIAVPAEGMSGGGELRVWDAAGRLVDRKALDVPEASLSTAKLPRGVYWIEVVLPEGRGVRRLVVDR